LSPTIWYLCDMARTNLEEDTIDINNVSSVFCVIIVKNSIS